MSITNNVLAPAKHHFNGFASLYVDSSAPQALIQNNTFINMSRKAWGLPIATGMPQSACLQLLSASMPETSMTLRRITLQAMHCCDWSPACTARLSRPGFTVSRRMPLPAKLPAVYMLHNGNFQLRCLHSPGQHPNFGYERVEQQWLRLQKQINELRCLHRPGQHPNSGYERVEQQWLHAQRRPARRSLALRHTHRRQCDPERALDGGPYQPVPQRQDLLRQQ